MSKAAWVELSQDKRLTYLRLALQQFIALEKEQDECCRNRELFKKTHLKLQLEKLITDYIQWDNEI